MAVSKQDVLAFISEYRTNNKRGAPRKAIIDHFGDSAAPFIDELKKDGTILAKRGRAGGLFAVGEATVESADTVTVDEPVQDAASEDTATDDVAAQFAALMEKLDEESAAISEAAPF